jgi:hypothetical protein
MVVSLRLDTSPGVRPSGRERPVGDRVSVPTALSMRSSLRSAGVLPLTARPRHPLSGQWRGATGAVSLLNSAEGWALWAIGSLPDLPQATGGTR